jgi:hypothetical protein
MTAKLKLVTYATADFRVFADRLCASALRSGFDGSIIYGPDDLKGTQFYSDNREILEHPRGAGYWLWKPYIIAKALAAASQDDVLLYCDAGRSAYNHFTRRPRRLEQRVLETKQGFLLGPSTPHFGSVRRWTKRDCLVLTGGDSDAISLQPILAASWSLWRPTPDAIGFLDRWIKFGCDPRCMTDAPNTLGSNYPEFVEHRYDQSIMSIMAHKEHAPFLNFDNSRVQRAIRLRQGSSLAHNFHKRPENADTLLGADNPLMLVRQYLRLRRAMKRPVSYV